MTRATRSTRTTVEHRFEVPCEEPYGGDMKDLGIAMTWAQRKAEELGIDTDADDWASLHTEEGVLVIVVRERAERQTIGCNLCGEPLPDGEPHLCPPLPR